MNFLIFFIIPLVVGQRKNFIQNLVSQLKNSPRHKSASPSFNGERKFDVIGTGELPLQSDRKISESGSQLRPVNINKAPSIDDVITGSIARFETSSDGNTGGENDAAGKDTNLPFLDKAQLTDPDTMSEQSQTEDQLLSQGSFFHNQAIWPPQKTQKTEQCIPCSTPYRQFGDSISQQR